MTDYEFILIGQSEVVDYEAFSRFPIDRLEVYRELVFPRMVHYRGRFLSHIDLINQFAHGKSYAEADPTSRRHMLNIWNLPGMSGIHLSNWLNHNGIKTLLINNFDSEFDLLADAYRACTGPKPLIGISGTFYTSYKPVRRITKFLQTLDPDVKVVLGGAFTNATATNHGPQSFEEPMKKHGIDYVLHAFNSEQDLLDLIRHHRLGSFEEVLNLAYFDTSSDLHLTTECWRDPMLDNTPLGWDRLAMPFVNRTLQTRTVSGCPFSCAFCSYPTSSRGLHTMEIERFEGHLKSLLKVPSISRIVFIDDTFNVPAERFKALLRMFMKYDFSWYSFLRCQFIDEETTQMMVDSGCQGVYLGVESASDLVLSNMNKHATRAEFVRGAQLLSKYGIEKMVAFVLGFPGETRATLDENVRFLDEVSAEYYTLKEFYYMKNTGVHKDRHKYGLEGMGSEWRHDTMDYQTASRHKLRLFSEIEASVFIDPDISLWHMVYMADQGFSKEEVHALQVATNAITKQQLRGVFEDDAPQYATIRKVVAAWRGRESTSPAWSAMRTLQS